MDEASIAAQEMAVEEELAKPLIGDLEQSFDVLREEHEDPIFRAKIKGLGEGYAGIRRVRRDGNCFLRGFLFAWMRQVMVCNLAEERDRVLALIVASKAEQIEAGMQEFIIEDFHEALQSLVEKLQQSELDEAELVELFRGGHEVDDAIIFLRMVVAQALRTHAESFSPFLEGCTVEDFIRTDVMPSNRECDQLQIMALATAWNVAVQVEYLDLSPGDKTTTHVIGGLGNPGHPHVHLLYRPGHYDVLYIA